jgi:mRNA-degrading endonuclease RelE of RelBE toxin-antitoxin system
MSLECNVFISKYFIKKLKPLVKKYPSLRSSISKELDNFVSKSAIDLGDEIYKLKIGTKDLPKGKNKSFRLIVYYLKMENVLLPLTIYFKSYKVNILDREIDKALEEVLFEFRNLKLLD